MRSFLRKLVYPIAQAPTGSIAGPELSIAVAKAGALGALGLTWADANTASQQVSAVRAEVGDQPFLANFVLHFPPLSLSAVLDAGAPIIAFSWGDATPYVAKVHAAGARVGVQVTSAMGARRALEAGADLIICQGIEAGGHVQSTSALAEILPAVVAEAGSVPIFAAGGIADGAGIAQVLNRGAAGAMLGTRFVATQESRAHPDYKAALLAAKGESATALTVCFDGGWPYAAHRVLRNSTFAAWEVAGCPPPGSRPGEGETVGVATDGVTPILRYEDTAPRIGMTGEVEAMCLYAGTGVGQIHDLPPAAEVVHRLWQECEAYRATKNPG